MQVPKSFQQYKLDTALAVHSWAALLSFQAIDFFVGIFGVREKYTILAFIYMLSGVVFAIIPTC